MTPPTGTGKLFKITDVLSVASDYLFPDSENEYPIDSVYRVLNYMSGESLFTHQLPRVAQEARPYLIEWYPWLRNIESYLDRKPKASRRRAQDFLAAYFIRTYGAMIELWPLPLDAHQQRHYYLEALDYWPPNQVIEFDPDEGERSDDE